MLKFLILATVAALCLSQDLGEDGYIACDDCRVPDDEFPEEGKWACFDVKRVLKSVKKKVEVCHEEECTGFFCLSPVQLVCEDVIVDTSVLQCQLDRKTAYNPITQISEGMFEITSPGFYGEDGYPNKTYCVWNVANGGIASYHIIHQELQEPGNCEGPGCDCPDYIKIKMGVNEVKLCGSDDIPSMTSMAYKYHVSSDGLHVKFCSDNKYTTKGVFLRATKSAQTEQKRQAIQSDKASKRLHRAVCQYDYMMRASQPDIPCPDDQTILNMLQYHDNLLSLLEQNNGMCRGMNYSSNMNSMMLKMNKIEMCAIEYLYHTRNCDFAEKVLNFSANEELSSVAHAVLANKLRTPTWMGTNSTNCT